MARKLHFKVDESGFMRLLKRDLYAHDDVCLRELIQNACDSSPKDIQLLLFRGSNPDSPVIRIGCVDNGSGMPKTVVRDQFLNLCKAADDNEVGTRFGRFGVGLFSYFQFASTVIVLTKPLRGMPSSLRIDVPDNISSISDLVTTSLDTLRTIPGTTILLTPRSPTAATAILRSLSNWVRSDIGASLRVRDVAGDWSPGDSSTFETPTQGKHFDPRPPGRVSRSSNSASPIVAVALKLTSGPDSVVLCEGGILVEENCADLIPTKYQGIGIQGLVNVGRRRLDLSADRAKARRDWRFDRIVREVEAFFKSELLRAMRIGPLSPDSKGWSGPEDALHRVLEASSTKDAVELLRDLETTLTFQVPLRGRLTLRSIVEAARPRGRVYFVDGESWAWRINIGKVDVYEASMLVNMSTAARAVALNGDIVLNIPRRTPDGVRFLTVDVLRQYLAYYGLNLRDAGRVQQDPTLNPTPFPAKWRANLRVPRNVSVGRLPAGLTSLFDPIDGGILDITKGSLKNVDLILDRPDALDSSTRAVLDSYVAILAADLDGAQMVLRDEIANITQRGPRNNAWEQTMRDVERVLASIVEEHRDNNWDEDFITRIFLHELLKCGPTTPTVPDGPTSVAMNLWKLSGKKEQEFGDIGILVRIRYEDKLEIEGAGFLEAKRRFRKSGKFDSMELTQLQTIYGNFPFAKLLLYDYSPVICSSILPEPRTTHGVTVPLPVVLHLNERDVKRRGEELYRFGTPISHQLVVRYFRGEDLDFTSRALDIVRGNLPGLLAPTYVLSAAVEFGSTGHSEVRSPNTNAYQLVADLR